MVVLRDLTPRVAAQRLGIRLDAVYAAIWAGRLTAHKKDGRWYVPSSEVEKRLKARGNRRRMSEAR